LISFLASSGVSITSGFAIEGFADILNSSSRLFYSAMRYYCLYFSFYARRTPYFNFYSILIKLFSNISSYEATEP